MNTNEALKGKAEMLLTQLANMQVGETIDFHKINWPVEAVREAASLPCFTFGFVVIETDETISVSRTESKELAAVMNALAQAEYKSSISVGIDPEKLLGRFSVKARRIIQKYFDEDHEKTVKITKLKNVNEMKQSRVIPRSYITGQLSGYVHNNKDFKSTNMQAKDFINSVIDNLVENKIMIELTPEQRESFHTNSRLYGVFQ